MVPNYVEVGYTQKPHGLSGELKVFVEEAFESDFVGSTVVLLELNGKPTPFFIESIRGASQFIVKFEGISDRDRAAMISSKKMLMKESDLTIEEELEAADEQDEAEIDWVGFTLIDTETNREGTILEVLEVNNQEILVLKHLDKEVLIPFVEAWIEELDIDSKKIVMTLPIGLFEL